MQCVNCQFENMPGTPLCVRCGTSLTLATAVISIHPPRAGKLQKELRRWVPFWQRYYTWRNRIASAWHSASAAVARDIAIRVPRFGTWVRMIVPGWAHLHEGQRVRARAFMRVWLAALFVGTLCYGTTIGAIAAGILFATFASSILDLLLQTNQRNLRTAVIATAMSTTIALVVYGPIALAIPRFVGSRQLLRTAAPFVSGDVILYNPRAFVGTSPRPGDAVLYRNAEFTTATTRRAWGDRRSVARISGEWVDRVVAGPNSTVRWDGEKVWVNGEPSTVQPLEPARLPAGLEVQVPEGACCIFPTTNPYLGQAASPALQSQCVVYNSQVVGKVLLRSYPFWRWWWVQ